MLVLFFVMRVLFCRSWHAAIPLAGNSEAVIRDRRALFNASTVTGTKTTLSGEYIARLRKGNSDLTGGHDRDRLRGLFTHNSSELEAKAGWQVS
jgi:hypothetical protein